MAKKITWATIENAPDFEHRMGFQNIGGDKRKVILIRHKATGTEGYAFPDTSCGRDILRGYSGALSYVFGSTFMDSIGY